MKGGRYLLLIVKDHLIFVHIMFYTNYASDYKNGD